MRNVLTGLLTALAMLGMILAVPGVWTSQHLVDEGGFVSSAREAAHLPKVQDYFAQQIVTEVTQASELSLAGDLVEPLAEAYTRSPNFVDDFAEIAGQQHGWLFTQPGPDDSRHIMDLDITPMVNRVLGQLPGDFSIDRQIEVPVDQNRLTAGSMESTGKVVTAVAWAAVVVGALAALGALIIGRRRGTVIAWLGVGAILAGAAGWLLSLYFKRLADDGAKTADLSAQETVKTVVSHIVDSLTTTSLTVAGVGLAVAVAGVLLRVLGSGRAVGL